MIAYLKLFRFPLVFTAVADSAAGYLLVTEGEPATPALLFLVVASAGLYMFGMATNDLADAERDRKLHPDRVLPSGKISVRGAGLASVFVLALSGGALVVMPGAEPARFIAWGGVVLLVLTYNTWIKIPLVMGLIRAGNFLMGAFSVLAFPPSDAHATFHVDPGPILMVALCLAVYGTGLTFVSTQEEGKTRRGLLLGFAGMMVVGAFGPSVVLAGKTGIHWGWLASGILVAWITFRALRARNRKGAMLLVRDGVAGFILVDASIVLATGAVGPGIAVASLLVPSFLCVAWFKRLK